MITKSKAEHCESTLNAGMFSAPFDRTQAAMAPSPEQHIPASVQTESSTMSDKQPVLQVQHISKSFGGVHALQDVDFAVVPGEVHAILGENGAGKSTLIKILTGFHQPDSGEIFLE